MSRSRSLTPDEERRVIRHARTLNARDRALVTAEFFMGFRVSETIALRISDVLKDGRIVDRVSLPPRFLKGGYGGTRVVPVGNELRRALESYLVKRARREVLHPNAPLFVSRQHDASGAPKPICRSTAEKLIKGVLLAVCSDKVGLSTHACRKTFANRVYRQSGNDLLIAKEALGHSNISTTQAYLHVSERRVQDAIRKSDWTRRSRRRPVEIAIPCGPDKEAARTVEAVRHEVKEPVLARAETKPAESAAPASFSEFLPGMKAFAA